MQTQVQVVRKDGREFVVMEKEVYDQLLRLVERVIRLSQKLEESLGEGQ